MHAFFHRRIAARRSPEAGGFVLNLGGFYDLFACVASPLAFGSREQTLRRAIVDLAHLRSGERVLDVGCGTGTLALVAKERVGAAGRVCGIDPGVQQIARARRKAARRDLAIEFEVGVVEALPFADGTFDVVLSTLMMHHLPDEVKRRGMAEIARVLTPGGRVLVVDMTGPDGPWESRVADQPALMQAAGFAQTEVGKTRFRGLSYAEGKKREGG